MRLSYLTHLKMLFKKLLGQFCEVNFYTEVNPTCLRNAEYRLDIQENKVHTPTNALFIKRDKDNRYRGAVNNTTSISNDGYRG